MKQNTKIEESSSHITESVEQGKLPAQNSKAVIKFVVEVKITIVDGVKTRKGGYGFLEIEGFKSVDGEGRERDIFFNAKNLIDIKFEDIRVGDDVIVGKLIREPRGLVAYKIHRVAE